MFTGEYTYEWITTSRVAHDSAYMKITGRTFKEFVNQYVDLKRKTISEEAILRRNL